MDAGNYDDAECPNCHESGAFRLIGPGEFECQNCGYNPDEDEEEPF